MPRYLIERRFPEGFDSFFLERPTDLIIAANNETDVTWLHSYVTDDSRRMYCLYEAPSPGDKQRIPPSWLASSSNQPDQNTTPAYLLPDWGFWIAQRFVYFRRSRERKMSENIIEEDREAAEESRLRRISSGLEGVGLRAAVSGGFTYRHAWQNPHNGTVILTLNQFFGIRPDWQVFVAAGEAVVRGDPVAGMFMGAARYTVNNVAPGSDVVVVRVTIESGSPLSIITDYLVVPA
jgi:hypothetical protein